MESLIFAIIQLGTLAIMIFYGKKLSLTSSNWEYWKTAIVPLFAYGIAYGLRFGRLIDWNVYYFRYINLSRSLETEDYEWLFEHICHFLGQSGVPYPGFVFLQCVFFMFSTLLLLSINKDIVRWGVPVAFIMGTGNEMFIRFFLGFSFSLIAIYFLLRIDLNIAMRYLCAILFVLLGGLCHNACYFMLLVVVGHEFLNLKTITWQVSIPMLFLTTFIFDISQFNFLVDWASYFYLVGGDEYHGAGYLQHVDDLIDGNFMSVGYMSRSLQTRIRTFCYSAPIFYYASKLVRKQSCYVFLYNLFVIGAILDPCFGVVELLNRISSSMIFIGCIPCALWYVSALSNINKNSVECYLVILSIFFLLYPYIIDALLRSEEKGLLFIWDASGRYFLPY